MKNACPFIYFTVLLLSGSAVNAQQTWPLYFGNIPNSLNCPDNEVAETTGRKVVRNVTVPTLTVFITKAQNSAKTAIIICPGGGYSNLSIQDGGMDAADELSKSGIVAFVLKYRTSNPMCNSNNALVPLQDLQQAIFTLKTNAAKWNIDPDKVGVLGFSAGGHLCALSATHYSETLIDAKDISLKPAFTILAYPVISFTDELTSKSSRTRFNLLGSKPTANQIQWFSPEKYVNSHTPPAFLVHASNDSTAMVENTIAYYTALHKFKVSAKMLIYQQGGHGFATYNKAENDHWLPVAIEWLKMNALLK